MIRIARLHRLVTAQFNWAEESQGPFVAAAVRGKGSTGLLHEANMKGVLSRHLTVACAQVARYATFYLAMYAAEPRFVLYIVLI